MIKNKLKSKDGDDSSFVGTNDEDETAKPDDEVDKLMKEADEAEEHEKYLKSPEYKAL